MSDICYKVVTHDNGKFYSSNTSLGNGRLQYKINKITRPRIKHSKIFVFKDFDSAKNYCRSNINFHILKCYCKFSNINCMVRAESYSSILEKTMFWEGGTNGYACLISGAYFADWVKPILFVAND